MMRELGSRRNPADVKKTEEMARAGGRKYNSFSTQDYIEASERLQNNLQELRDKISASKSEVNRVLILTKDGQKHPALIESGKPFLKGGGWGHTAAQAYTTEERGRIFTREVDMRDIVGFEIPPQVETKVEL